MSDKNDSKSRTSSEQQDNVIQLSEYRSRNGKRLREFLPDSEEIKKQLRQIANALLSIADDE